MASSCQYIAQKQRVGYNDFNLWERIEMMKFEKNACVIINAYSTGKFLAPAFIGNGYPCIHIKSDPTLPSKYKHNTADFIESLVYTDDIDAILTSLQKYKIKCVIAGSESGIDLADKLNALLDLPGNTPNLSRARRDKYLMTEVIAQAGLKTVRHYKSDAVDDILSWATQLGQLPVVLKPLESQSGDHVFFCHNEREIRESFYKIKKSINLFGKSNEEVLAQSFNPWEEYIVNTVSCQSQHYTVEIWRVTKLPNSTIYDYAELIHADEPEFKPLTEYTNNVLNAVGIKYGAATTELKYTLKNGPVLIETTSRPMAGAPLSLSREMHGHTQIDLTIEAYLNPTDFLRRTHEAPVISKKYAVAVVLISDIEGTLAKDIDTNDIKQLNTINSFMLDGESGSQIKKTVDTLTAPGEIYLIGADRASLLSDRDAIRKLEQRGLYRDALQNEVLALTPPLAELIIKRSDSPLYSKPSPTSSRKKISPVLGLPRNFTTV